MESINNILKTSESLNSLGFSVPKKILKPTFFHAKSTGILDQISNVGVPIFREFVYQHDRDRDTFPGYFDSFIKGSIKIIDSGFYVGLKDYTGNVEIRSFALMSSSPVDILEVCINLIIGDLEDFPILLKNIIGQYDNLDYYNLYSYVPNNEIIIQIFLNAGFEKIDQFYGGINHRIKFIKMNFRLTQHQYPERDPEERKKFFETLNLLNLLKKEEDDLNSR